MSIPVSIDPMGTLGGGYVTDGLILWFDALMEPDGQRNYLTNQVSGTQCIFSKALTIGDGVISNDGSSGSSYNSLNSAEIDGVPAFGIGYSAEICTRANPAASNVAVSGVPWGNIQAWEGAIYPGWQIFTNAKLGTETIKTLVRINYLLEDYKVKLYKFDDYIDRSFYMELGRVCVNGDELVNDGATGGVSGSTFALGAGVRFGAYRLYSRHLSVSEQKQNYALDKKRFNLP